MPDTTSASNLDLFKEELEKLADHAPPQLSQAVRDLLAAASYSDTTLVDSTLNSLFEAMRLVARDIIQKELASTAGMRAGVRILLQTHFDGRVCEDFDALKEMLESEIDKRLATMTWVRDEQVRPLEEQNYPVENAQQLDEGIRDLRRWRESLLKDWPDPSKPPASIDKDAIAQARAALKQGKGRMSKDDMLRGVRAKKTG